ncbi:MAG: hypothetical protein K6G10_12545 [Butyrivibrio sp.]|nr:hypothetical protein [Butyrivibrio sp.]
MDFYYIIAAIVTMIVVAYLLGIRDARKAKRYLQKKLSDNFGKAPDKQYKDEDFEHLKGYYLNHKNDFQIDDTTWNDLDMDRVFVRTNYCLSAAGEEYLYYLLRTPSLVDDFEKQEKEVSYLQENDDIRKRLQLIFYEIGNNRKYSIYQYIRFLENVGNTGNVRHFAMLGLMGLSVVICFLNFKLGFILLIALMLLNIFNYFKTKGDIDPYLTTYGYIMRVIKSVDAFSAVNDEAFSDTFKEMSQISKEFSGFKAGASILMAPARMNSGGNPADLMMDYIRMVTHIDIIKFNQMYRELMKKMDSLDRILTLTGRLEAEISIACFRESFKENVCIPEFTKEGYNAKGLVHPLISDPVCNDIDTDKGLLITGSNASGKSTFLKTCAINSILSQTIHTVLGKSYKAPLFRIFSSMALKDDLTSGESYYIVEIKSLKRILDATKDASSKVLCFIDEVLRGTNTVERIAASCQILKRFSAGNIMCFAATHDIELTELLAGDYNMYHFEGNILDNDVHFDYEIKNGPANNRNAIRLLGVLGYEDDITEKAENMAQNFLKSGVWK